VPFDPDLAGLMAEEVAGRQTTPRRSRTWARSRCFPFPGRWPA